MPRAAPNCSGDFGDLVALAVIKVFRSKGLEVPRDISVVGIDDIDWSMYNEPR